MWIMMIAKLPTDPSPPKLSIFWSTSADNQTRILDQFNKFFAQDMRGTDFNRDARNEKLSAALLKTKKIAFMREQEDYFYDYAGFGKEDNWAKARWIVYNDAHIRVFAHEYSVLAPENLLQYVGIVGNDASHVLVPSNAAMEKTVQDIKDGHLREIYDAALMDGCTHYQANAMALGLTITGSMATDVHLPVDGWYRIKSEYGLIYCTEDELEG